MQFGAILLSETFWLNASKAETSFWDHTRDQSLISKFGMKRFSLKKHGVFQHNWYKKLVIIFGINQKCLTANENSKSITKFFKFYLNCVTVPVWRWWVPRWRCCRPTWRCKLRQSFLWAKERPSHWRHTRHRWRFRKYRIRLCRVSH